jgi:hypothetical protein
MRVIGEKTASPTSLHKQLDCMYPIARAPMASLPLPPLQIWDEFVTALANLGQSTLREGLVKDSQGRDIDLSPQTEQELVDYEGMLVSGAVAQRRCVWVCVVEG